MTIDFNKPVQTRDGRKVRILCTDGPNEKRPVAGFVEGYVEPTTWESCGKFSERGNTLDLINAPERVEQWVNLYRSGSVGSTHNSRKNADGSADSSARRTGVIRITYEDDRPISVALEDI